MDANSAVAFVRVVEKGSFSAAAALVGVPRSTVSRRVAALEQAIGVRLLERNTRSLRLTEAGRAYFGEAGAAVHLLEQATQTALDGGTHPRGLVRLTAPVVFGQLVLSDVLPALMKRYSELTMAIDLHERVVNLIDEGVDLAIRAGELPSSSLTARRLGETTVGLYASPDYLARQGTPQSPEALEQHHVLTNGTLERPAPWRFRFGGRLVTVEPKARVTVHDFVILRAMCAAGVGITRLPSFIADELVASGALRPVLGGVDFPAVPVSVVWPAGRHLPSRTRAVVDFLEEVVPALLRSRASL